ncbi:MAG: S41 family peptidase [Mariprofundaceae bacterium]|nr:S41 family peptidase [Mariprofundaceae bacterium]
MLRRIAMLVVVLAITAVGVLAGKPGEIFRQAVAATDYRQLQKFSRVMEIIRNSYVEEVTDEELVDGALSGMLSGLDPHSAYLDKDMYRQMQVDTRGKFGGLGIEIVAAEGGIRVVTPIEDTPADRAGIKAGDLIIKINDELAKDMTLPEAVKMMRGKPGTSIRLTIFRESAAAEGPLEFTIVRAVIHVKSVKADMLAPGYAYLRITQFQEKTDTLLKKQIAELKKRAGGRLHGAVLDLRNNPGGLLDQAVMVSDLFLDKGGIVSTKSRMGKNLSFSANRGDVLRGLPLVVLVNHGSASASEIVAGALQDNHRAVLVGTQTFGKGSVQSVVPLNDGTAFKLTTALYFTPSGRSIQATGITPEIIVEPVQVAVSEKKGGPKFPSISERDLRGHLENGSARKTKAADKGEPSAAMKKRLSRDTQLQRALDLLRGLNALYGARG